MSHERPSWQEEYCPIWCSRAHSDADLHEDRVHASNAVEVPVITRNISVTNDRFTFDLIFVTTLLVGIARATGERLTWISLTDEERNGFDMTLDSAELLLQGLKKVVSMAWQS